MQQSECGVMSFGFLEGSAQSVVRCIGKIGRSEDVCERHIPIPLFNYMTMIHWFDATKRDSNWHNIPVFGRRQTTYDYTIVRSLTSLPRIPAFP